MFLTAENLGMLHEGNLLERKGPGSKVCRRGGNTEFNVTVRSESPVSGTLTYTIFLPNTCLQTYERARRRVPETGDSALTALRVERFSLDFLSANFSAASGQAGIKFRKVMSEDLSNHLSHFLQKWSFSHIPENFLQHHET